MGILNIGGGLAVDYDGSRTNFASSSNYSMQEYASDIVEILMRTADETSIPHPMIISESGRATITHHSVLIFNALDVRKFEPHRLPSRLPDNSIQMLQNLMETRDTLNPRNIQEVYHDAVHYRDELRAMFLQGNATLRERALGENIFWHIIRSISNLVQNKSYIPDEMAGLDSAIADVYYCNFSLFQSLPDSWAVDQLFPIMPIQRLAEMPARQGVIADITCDSDGKIDTFTDLHDVKRILPLHELNEEDYYIGVFLVGAYQETLGDMHNLLGNINVVHIRADEQGRPRYIREVPGDTVEEVLSFVEYKPRDVTRKIRLKAEKAWKSEKISTADKNSIISAFTCGMEGYTYFEK
jgi:arginine decarboxylase